MSWLEFVKLLWEERAVVFDPGRYWQMLVRRLTRHYPFSLFYRDTLIHYRHRELYAKVAKLRNLSKQFDSAVLIKTIDLNSSFYDLRGEFEGSAKYKGVKRLEKLMQKSIGDVYVRKLDGGELNIIVPRE